MNDPHDKQNYSVVGEQPVSERPKTSKKKLSGAYYYVDTDEQKLREQAFIRTVLTIIAVMLQLITLALPQGGLEYITENIPSLAYAYMWAVFVMLAIAVWLIIMNAVRYKIVKRIPVERAPKKGFANRAYFGAELYIASNAMTVVFELVFVCIHFDAVGLIAFFVCAGATVAAVFARIVTHNALKNSTLVPATPEDTDAGEEGEATTE